MPEQAIALANAANLVVHIVDDDEAVRRSLAMLLAAVGLQAQTHPSAEALLEVEDLAPGCAIVDIRMPGPDGTGMDGLALQLELTRRGLTLPIVVVTGHADVALAVRAMKAGAVDFIEKPYSEADILRAVTVALARSANSFQQRQTAVAASAKIATLTPREGDVLRLLVDGWPNKVVAHELGISPRTVEIHRANAMEKLGCRSLAEAVRIAMAAGFGQG